MRAALVLVAALLLAGCAAPERTQLATLDEPGVLSGVVTTDALEPLAGARVVIDGRAGEAITDATGAFRMTLPAGELLVLASAEGHRGQALRATLAQGGAATLAFALAPLPREAPSVEVSEQHGLLSCGATIAQGADATTFACGSSDPNQRALFEASIAGPGLEGAVIELVWEATTPASRALSLVILAEPSADAPPIARAEGEGRVSILLPARALDAAIPGGGALGILVQGAGSFTDEEAGIDAGAQLQQPFAVYVSVFRHAAPPAGYSVLA